MAQRGEVETMYGIDNGSEKGLQSSRRERELGAGPAVWKKQRRVPGERSSGDDSRTLSAQNRNRNEVLF